MVSKASAEIMVERAGWKYTTKEKFNEIHNKKIGVGAIIER